MNFWELILDDVTEDEDEKNLMSQLFDANDRERIINIMRDYIEKKNDIVSPFMNRVTDQIAPDYRQHITAEMFLALIEQRIFNNYYRSPEVKHLNIHFL